MPTPRAAVTITHRARAQQDRAIARADFIAAERDLYRRHGPTAARHLDDDDRRRLARLAKAIGWKRVKRDATIVALATLRRWHHRLLQAPDLAGRRGSKPRTTIEVEALVIQAALDNSWGDDAWGRRRIVGELAGQGITIGETTVVDILRRHGIPPAPARGRGRDEPRLILADGHGATGGPDGGPAGSPSTDPVQPPDNAVAIDFLVAPCLSPTGALGLAYVLVALHQPSRRATLLGVRRLGPGTIDHAFLEVAADRLRDFRRQVASGTVLMDRDSLYRAAFIDRLRADGAQVCRTPPRCPWRNGYAERFVQTLKRGALRQALPIGERALGNLVEAFLDQYHHSRPHQGLGNRMVMPSAAPSILGQMVRVPLVYGLINRYVRQSLAAA